MSLTLDDRSQASLPGGLTVDLNKYLDYHGLESIFRWYYHRKLNYPMDELKRKASRSSIVYSYIHTCEHLKHGCINPSIVLDAHIGLVATYTDLTNDGGEATSVIKIMKIKKPVFFQMGFKSGEEIATVSLYQADENRLNARAWIDFEPLIPLLLCADYKECQRTKDRLGSAEWKCLYEGLKQVPNVSKPGLYYVSLDSDLTDQTYMN